MSAPAPEPEPEPVAGPASDPPPNAKRWRIVLLVLFFVGSLAIAKATGATEYLDIERVRTFMEEAGPLGFIVFVALFVVGELLHVPGLVFVGAASVAYGDVHAILAAYFGAIASVTTSFLVVRTIGGQPLGAIRRPIVRKVLARLDTRPVMTVAILRLLFWMSPALNYGLAMSKVKLRHYLAGSALGLLIPIPAVVLLFDWIAARFL